MTQNTDPQNRLDEKFASVLFQFEAEGAIDEISLEKMQQKYLGLDEDGKIVLVKQLFDALDKSTRDSDYLIEYRKQKSLVEKDTDYEAEKNALIEFYIEKNDKEALAAETDLKSLEEEMLNNEKLYNLGSSSTQPGATLTLDQLLTPTQPKSTPLPQTSFTNSSNIRSAPQAPMSTNRIPLPNFSVPPASPLQPPNTQAPRVHSQVQEGRANQFQQPVQNPSPLITSNQAPTNQYSQPLPQPLPRPWNPANTLIRPPVNNAQPQNINQNTTLNRN